MPTNFKELSLKVFLQGLYNTTTHKMNQCKINNISITTKWSGRIVDTITVELHSATNYATIVYSSASGGKNIEIDKDGNVNSNGKTFVEIPKIYNGSYYITIKSRNHLETTSATAVSFSNQTISYDFSTAASQAYGSNQKLLELGVYGIYAGDTNGDGFVNITDRSMIQTAVLNAASNYNRNDINGDGTVNIIDRSIGQTAVLNAVSKKTP